MRSRRFVLFTDLDGTLLDKDTYSAEDALRGIELLRQNKTPVVFCSSKTRNEQEWYRDVLGINDPFVVEDGGAIVLEEKYFFFPFHYQKRISGRKIIEIGPSYSKIRETLRNVESELNMKIVGYGDLSPSEVASLTGLSEEQAVRAKAREYQETIVSDLRDTDVDRLKSAIEKRGLAMTRGGRFIGVGGYTDKGIAVDILTTMFRQKYGEVWTVGIGDSFNDIAMFLSVDIPVLVQKKEGHWEEIGMEGIHRVDGVGPRGWNGFVTEWFSQI